MILITNEKIIGSKAVRADQPFQIGELFVVKYMTIPTVVTVLNRTAEGVTTWNGTESIDFFNRRVLFKLGHRARLFGIWLPWAIVDPQRVINLHLDDALGTDQAFWTVKKVESV